MQDLNIFGYYKDVNIQNEKKKVVITGKQHGFINHKLHKTKHSYFVWNVWIKTFGSGMSGLRPGLRPLNKWKNRWAEC